MIFLAWNNLISLKESCLQLKHRKVGRLSALDSLECIFKLMSISALNWQIKELKLKLKMKASLKKLYGSVGLGFLGLMLPFRLACWDMTSQIMHSEFLYFSVYTEKGKGFVLSVHRWQSKVAPPVTNFVISPHCFSECIICDVMPQLASLKGLGALDPKNPDLYYFHPTQLKIPKSEFRVPILETRQRNLPI